MVVKVVRLPGPPQLQISPVEKDVVGASQLLSLTVLSCPVVVVLVSFPKSHETRVGEATP